MAGDAGEAYAPGLKLKEEQNLVRGQPSPREHFDREEIDASQNCHVDRDEILPICIQAALGPWSDTVPPQDVAHGLIREFVSKVRKGSDDSVIAPARILSRHSHDELNNLAPNRRPPRIRTLFGTIELLGDKPSVLRKDRVRFGHAGFLMQTAHHPRSAAFQCFE